MASTLQTLADAVTAAINAAGLTPSFTAVRKWRPDFSISDGDFSTLRVMVVPVGLTTATRRTRSGLYDRALKIEVGILVKPAATSDDALESAIDAYAALVESVQNLLDNANMTANGHAFAPMTVEVPEYCDRERLEQQRIVLGIVSITYHATY